VARRHRLGASLEPLAPGLEPRAPSLEPRASSLEGFEPSSLDPCRRAPRDDLRVALTDMADPTVPRSAEEAKALEQLKALIARDALAVPGEEYARTCGDDVRLRFLRGHKLRPAESLKLLKRAGAWRASYRTDSLIGKYETSAAVDVRFAKAYLPMGVIGHDREGRPVVYDHLAGIDFPRILSDFGLDRALEYAIYTQERIMENNRLGEAISIIDLGMDGLDEPIIGSLFEARTWVAALLRFLQPFAGMVDPCVVVVKAPLGGAALLRLTRSRASFVRRRALPSRA